MSDMNDPQKIPLDEEIKSLLNRISDNPKEIILLIRKLFGLLESKIDRMYQVSKSQALKDIPVKRRPKPEISTIPKKTEGPESEEKRKREERDEIEGIQEKESGGEKKSEKVTKEKEPEKEKEIEKEIEKEVEAVSTILEVVGEDYPEKEERVPNQEASKEKSEQSRDQQFSEKQLPPKSKNETLKNSFDEEDLI